ncbi:MAG: cyclic nucleotide-binding domain-containing protein [Myxococcota bacterium]|nr:cyclic nucleotide-binding domain-containing protein [Myxococcota bacterium]
MDANRLRIVEVFAEFDDRELSLLASVMTTRHYEPEHTIFQKGARATACYVVLTGSVEVTVEGEGQMQTTVAEMTPGKLFGEIALVDGGLRSATCQAGSDGVELAILGRTEFEQIFNAGNSFAFKLLDIVGDRVVERVRKAAGELVDVVLAERTRPRI